MKSKTDYLIFGAQYYRAPTPEASNFEEDLKNFAEHGFNTIKVWVQWRWNNPSCDEYNFDDILLLLDIAYRYQIKVILNIICDVAPAWFYQKYPDSLMITSDGRKLYPQTTAYRQIGGAPGPCYHHPEGIECRRAFVEAAAKALSSHPALVCWDLWNEPELTCGIKREPRQEDMVCYCDNCKKAFLEWLMKKYGTVEKLNRAWGRNYTCIEEVELPRSRSTFQDMIDWRLFFADTLAEECRMRAEAVKKYDSKNPVMVHTVPLPYFNMVNACSDDYLLAQSCDMFGNSLGSSPFSATVATSVCPGKRVINAEIHAIGGDTFNRPSIPTFDDMKKHILIPLARGVKGFLFWQYRPESIGLESPAWGLTDLKGKPTQWLEQAKLINNALQRYQDLLLNSSPIPARVAILNSGESQIFTWCISGETELYYQSIKGIFDALYEKNIAVDIISEHQLNSKELSLYQCLIAPFPYYISKKYADEIRAWVENGGTLISEALFGTYDSRINLHAPESPGYGFAEVFGAHEKRIFTASRFNNAYKSKWAEEENDNTFYIKAQDLQAKGFHFRQELEVTTAKPVGFFESDDGELAIASTANSYGRGKAVLIGSLIGKAYFDTRHHPTKEFICRLVSEYSPVRPVANSNGRVDFLFNEGNLSFVIAQSMGQEKVTVESEYLKPAKKLINIMNDAEIEIVNGTAALDIVPMGIEIYRVIE